MLVDADAALPLPVTPVNACSGLAVPAPELEGTSGSAGAAPHASRLDGLMLLLPAGGELPCSSDVDASGLGPRALLVFS